MTPEFVVFTKPPPGVDGVTTRAIRVVGAEKRGKFGLELTLESQMPEPMGAPLLIIRGRSIVQQHEVVVLRACGLSVVVRFRGERCRDAYFAKASTLLWSTPEVGRRRLRVR